MKDDERCGYFICNIKDGTVYAYGCIVSSFTADLPDGRRLYRAQLKNGLDIILISKPATSVGGTFFEQEFTIFDMPMRMTYSTLLEVRFYVNDSAPQYYNCGIFAVDRSSERNIGDLIFSEDVIAFDMEIVQDKESRLLYTKALLFAG